MKRIAQDILCRILMVATFFLYPIFALLALPWAWFDSIGSLGYTTMRSWQAGWRFYAPASLRDFRNELFKGF